MASFITGACEHPELPPVLVAGVRLLRLRFLRAPRRSGNLFKFNIAVTDEAGDVLSTAVVENGGVPLAVVCTAFSNDGAFVTEPEPLAQQDGPLCAWSGTITPRADLADASRASELRIRVYAVTAPGEAGAANPLDVVPVTSAPLGSDGLHCERSFALAGMDRPIRIREEFALTIGAHVWNAGVVLAQYVIQRAEAGDDFLRGKVGLEIGSGCGLTGIVAASLGAEMTLTDRRESQLALLRLNASQNDVGAATLELDWTAAESGHETSLSQTYGVVLAADVLYGGGHDKILAVLQRHASASAEILIAHTKRYRGDADDALHPFFELASVLFDVEFVAASLNVVVVRLSTKKDHGTGAFSTGHDHQIRS